MADIAHMDSRDFDALEDRAREKLPPPSGAAPLTGNELGDGAPTEADGAPLTGGNAGSLATPAPLTGGNAGSLAGAARPGSGAGNAPCADA